MGRIKTLLEKLSWAKLPTKLPSTDVRGGSGNGNKVLPRA